jgi:hypothetical protein
MQTPHRIRRWWPALIIIGAACVFCWPVFAGRIMLPADMCLLMLPWRALQSQFPDFYRPHNPMLDPIQQYLPWRIFVVESVRSGLIPLWNPYQFCGTPFLANLQSTLLYPLNLLFLITGARHGFGVSAIIHLALGGLFTYGFLRALDLRRPAALLGALIVMFNGYTVSWLEYPTLSLWVFMWLPAILLCYERSLRQPRSLWPIALTLTIAMQFLGGHLQVSSYVVIAFLIYVAVRCVVRRGDPFGSPVPPPVPTPRTILLALIPLILGLALAAGQILPTLELAGLSGRVAHGSKGALSTAFPLTHFVLYLVPNFFGNPVDYNYWGYYRDQTAFNFFETACYVGVLPLFLAAWSLRWRREPAFWFFAVLVLFAVLAAIGSPVYYLLYYLAPGFRELAGLGRVLCLAAFGLAGLAALGLDSLLQQTESAPPRAAFLFGALAIAAAWGAYLIHQPLVAALDPKSRFPQYQTRQFFYFIVLVVATSLIIALRSRAKLRPPWFAAAAIGILIADLFGFGFNFNPYMPASMAYPETDSTRWIEQNIGHDRFTSLAAHGLDWMPANAAMAFGLRDIHGSDSLRVRSSFDLVSPPGKGQAEYPAPNSPLMDQLGVRYLMTRQELSRKWKLAHNADAPIYENTAAQPRARVSSGTNRAGQACPERSRRELASCPVTFTRDAPDAITLTLDSQQAGQLTLTDSYYPGWRAWVDGRPAPITRYRDAFRSITVPAGKHTIEMRYEPATFRIGLFISLLALALLTAAAAPLLAAQACPERSRRVGYLR